MVRRLHTFGYMLMLFHCWNLSDFEPLCSLSSHPGRLAGQIQTTLPSARPAWTNLPAGLALCLWSIRKWDWIRFCLKTRSPSCVRNTGKLSASDQTSAPYWACSRGHWDTWWKAGGLRHRSLQLSLLHFIPLSELLVTSLAEREHSLGSYTYTLRAHFWPQDSERMGIVFVLFCFFKWMP